MANDASGKITAPNGELTAVVHRVTLFGRIESVENTRGGKTEHSALAISFGDKSLLDRTKETLSLVDEAREHIKNDFETAPGDD